MIEPQCAEFNDFFISSYYCDWDEKDLTIISILDCFHIFKLSGDHFLQLRDCATQGGLHSCIDYFIDNISESVDTDLDKAFAKTLSLIGFDRLKKLESAINTLPSEK